MSLYISFSLIHWITCLIVYHVQVAHFLNSKNKNVIGSRALKGFEAMYCIFSAHKNTLPTAPRGWHSTLLVTHATISSVNFELCFKHTVTDCLESSD